MMSASLIYPKEGIPSIEAIREISLQDRTPLDFTEKPWIEKLLFKQSFHGDSALQVKISAKTEVSKVTKIINKVVQAGVIAGIGTISGGLAGLLLAPMLKTVTESVFDFAEPKDKISIIGEGFMPINNDTPEGDFVVQLSVPKELKLKQRRFQEDQEVIETITLRKGYANAMVVFDIKKHPLPSMPALQA